MRCIPTSRVGPKKHHRYLGSKKNHISGHSNAVKYLFEGSPRPIYEAIPHFSSIHKPLSLHRGWFRAGFQAPGWWYSSSTKQDWWGNHIYDGINSAPTKLLKSHSNPMKMWVKTMPFAPSPSHHHFYRWCIGKQPHNYGKSPFYSWVNPLFRLGHGFNSFWHNQRVVTIQFQVMDG